VKKAPYETDRDSFPVASDTPRRAALDGARRSTSELAAAYDSTLEAWVRMLELRDQETEGHSRRVTGMTVELARALEVPSDRVDDFRRGALLHDIGKMGGQPVRSRRRRGIPRPAEERDTGLALVSGYAE